MRCLRVERGLVDGEAQEGLSVLLEEDKSVPEHLAPTSALRAGRSIPHSKFCYSRAHDSDADARKSRRDQRCCDSLAFFF